MSDDVQPDSIEEGPAPGKPLRPLWQRIVAAIGIAALMGLGGYALISAVGSGSGALISFTFLLILPAAICGLVCCVIDPRGQRSGGFYLMVPVWILLAAIILGAVVLREGVICIIMLTPLWLISGAIGAGLGYRLTHRATRENRAYSMALFVAPLVAMQVEPMIPVPQTYATVTRTIVVAAPPERIWPLLRGIPDVRPGEGRWNISQDLIGIPRPLGARLLGQGVGAERLANWGHNVRFRERITQWRPGRRIGWRFVFDDIAGWAYTDRHLMPDSRYFRVMDGGYSLDRIDAHRTRVTIDTRYWIQTPVNGYSRLWGELLLGDLENNLLALVKARAESGARTAS
ncbi:SRPBCC family protein [Sphingobium nicotianae]|uniref:SRPBCC family protein n=1 Tax=Sphingobium nicotianae TaxID=2782607 RepID=A0A9X1DBL1_9SPHN|nr:SRPBCC family protein [Sphingobium nicotianae]MBT2187001.1 SRPBCC family protein [Sphingobium nicotianae]